MPTCCCVPECSNRGGIEFPSDPDLRSKWVQAVRRESEDGKHKLWMPKPTSVVCHSQFKPSDYITATATGTSPIYRKRKADAVPSIFPWRSNNLNKSNERDLRYNKRCTAPLSAYHDSSDEILILNTSSELDIGNECEVTNSDCENRTDSSDSEDADVEISTCSKLFVDSFTNTDPLPMISVERFVNNDAGMLFYTGLASYTDFLHVFYSLGEASYHLNYLYSQVTNVSVENQLFLTLIKLRCHKTNFELSRLFAISQKTVENIWVTWINFMKLQWSELNIWPSRDLVRYFSPSDFFAKFPTCYN